MILDKTNIAEAIEKARLLIDIQEEPYRSVAFGVVLSKILSQNANIGSYTHDGETNSPTNPKSLKNTSVREFMRSKDLQNDVQKTLAIAYYLEKHEVMQSFNIADIKEGFGKAKEPAPKNINDKINMNIKKGHIMEAGEKDGQKAWQLTSTGETYVETNFEDS